MQPPQAARLARRRARAVRERLIELVLFLAALVSVLTTVGIVYILVKESVVFFQAVPIVNDNGQAVEPSMEAVLKGSYTPLARPIFIYVSARSNARPEVREFVDYYMTRGAALAKEVKYVPLPDPAYATALQHVQKGKKGTVFGGVAEVGVTIDELLKREAKL